MLRFSIPLLFATSALASEKEPDLFTTSVRPVLESACVTCHNEEKDKGDIRLDTREAALASISENDMACLVPEGPDESGLYYTSILPEDDDLAMPPKGDRLSKIQTDVLKKWIEEGAAWPDDVTLEAVRRIDFAEHVQPILETQCVSCHKTGDAEGGWDTTTRELAFNSGDNAPNIVPFSAEGSAIYFLCALDADDDDLMPPAKSGGPLKDKEILILKDWVAQGANWPESITLTQREKTDGAGETPDNLDLVKKIHAKIVATTEAEGNNNDPYTATIPISDASFDMVPITGGSYLMGAPDSDSDADDDEQPQREISVAPFWMGKTEVTWAEYSPFQVTKVDRFKNGSPKVMPENPDLIDAVSQPTTPYVEMSFGMGIDGYPAIAMSQHAALKYCQWLSSQTGHFYRLPTEAEWEYAARAGTTTKFYFGDTADAIDDYEWYYENAGLPEEKYQMVGKKKPNPWGLHDMLGNVKEWCMDGYEKDAYTKPLPDIGYTETTARYPRVARGGEWDSDPEDLRVTARSDSKLVWNKRDPQLPKSIWYETEGLWLGFRVVRPMEVPSAEDMYRIWNAALPQEE
ncbi:SUMF1/EgtB/PvdO family nonheme iron enzyme [Verrucomicrobiales bacterium]|nr:SUMF1/EgtB/PvdO family nonheme iron enzyme [Verrucomicrobiales bacterium]